MRGVKADWADFRKKFAIIGVTTHTLKHNPKYSRRLEAVTSTIASFRSFLVRAGFIYSQI